MFSFGEQVVVIHLTIWISCRCGGRDSVSCRLWGETTLQWKCTVIPMKSFLVCGYGKSVTLKGYHSFLIIQMTLNFETAPIFI